MLLPGNESVEAVKAELDARLRQHGAHMVALGHDDEQGRAFILFATASGQVRMLVPMPRPSDWPDPSTHSWLTRRECPSDWNRWSVHQRVDWVRAELTQAIATRWRSILAIVSAKLDWIALGMSTLEREFLPDVVLPGGRTFGESRPNERTAAPSLAPAAFSAPPALPVSPAPEQEWAPSTALVVRR